MDRPVDLVALADDPAFALFHVAWTPRYVYVVRGGSPVLDVDTNADLLGRADQHSDFSAANLVEQVFSRRRRLVVVDKRDLVIRLLCWRPAPFRKTL